MKRLFIGLAAFVGLLAAALSVIAGPNPRDWWGLTRYALPRMHAGDLKVGDLAPDATLVALDGKERFSLQSRFGGRPLVLVFGSFT
jgi:hypothetical protein